MNHLDRSGEEKKSRAPGNCRSFTEFRSDKSIGWGPGVVL